MHAAIKKALGYELQDDEMDILGDWKKRTSELCKPCWELHSGPYGPVVEEYPLLPVLRDDAKQHYEYLLKCFETGLLVNGEDLDGDRRDWFNEQVDGFDPRDYPESIPEVLGEASCRVFGHMSIVFRNGTFSRDKKSPKA